MRYRNIDLMKVIAMYLVILYHFTTMQYDFISNPQLISYINYSIRTICSMCVPLFFFVNGFLLIKKEINIKKHVNKILKMVIQAVIWSIIGVVLISNICAESLSFYDLFLEIWTRKTGMVGHIWYIGALVCIYIFFPLIKNAYDTNKKVFNYFIAACTILVFGNQILSMIVSIGYGLVFGWIDHSVADNVLNMYNPFNEVNAHAFGYFCIGCFIGGYHEKFDDYIKRYFNNLRASLGIIISTVLLSGYGIVYSLIIGKVYDNVWYGYDTIFTLINVICTYVLTKNYKGVKENFYKYIKCISQNTLGIFFIHVIIVRCLTNYGMRQWAMANNAFVNVLLAYFILNISLILVLLLKRIPYIRLLVD